MSAQQTRRCASQTPETLVAGRWEPYLAIWRLSGLTEFLLFFYFIILLREDEVVREYRFNVRVNIR